MSYQKIFMPEDKPLIKPRFVAVEESWELVSNVFPEPGFRSYFLGHVVEKLADELRKNNIKNYYDRQRFAHLSTVPGLLSHISFAGAKAEPNVGRGIDGVHDQDAHRSGDPASDAELVIRQAKESQSQEGSEEAELGRSTLVCDRCDLVFKGAHVVVFNDAMIPSVLCPSCAAKTI